MKTKICSNPKCKNPEKPITEFSKHFRYKDGLKSWCKECVKEYQKDYYIKKGINNE